MRASADVYLCTEFFHPTFGFGGRKGQSTMVSHCSDDLVST